MLKREKELLLNTYNRIPIEFTHGKGIYLISKSGERYLDFFSGLGVNALGHAHPKIIEAVKSQISNYIHLSNYYLIEPQLQLAELLIKHSGLSRVFFTNSGTESVEAALKLIRKIKGPEKNIYALSGAFHGRSYGALSLTQKEKCKLKMFPSAPLTSALLTSAKLSTGSTSRERCVNKKE